MKNNPKDWNIDQLKKLAVRYSIEWRQNGTSHVQFVRQDGITLTVPAHRLRQNQRLQTPVTRTGWLQPSNIWLLNFTG